MRRETHSHRKTVPPAIALPKNPLPQNSLLVKRILDLHQGEPAQAGSADELPMLRV
jgi:hypothetical protein